MAQPLRPFITVVLAISLDGKIADRQRSPARFGSAADKHHLESQIAQVDAVLFGADTLRSYGTTLPISHPEFLRQRQAQNKPPQPTHIVCSASGNINPQLAFFRQPIPRWLLTTATGAEKWTDQDGFERIIVAEQSGGVDWVAAFQRLATLGCDLIAALGGGELIAGLLTAECVDEFWVTVCPLILGGRNAPTLVEGEGFLEAIAPRLELIEARSLDQEVFLHYRVKRKTDSER
ncbi:RibD family protein [Phormidium sp. CLA17]|uniref:RibD family protein n=1 Tax=Leptolyngbya sp. Cla-17 TaxID=2803751 RepID=UPI0014916916|nr:RibD family protein [Leptolyngbya sp. Cla-17]MBM0741303.1 RibD family protein [Leptolyngbya sp. Cla-17]